MGIMNDKFWNGFIYSDKTAHVLVSSSSILVNISSASSFINYANKNGRTILGFEGFMFDGKKLTADQTKIVDYSSSPNTLEMSVVNNILMNWSDSVHFVDFTLKIS